MQTAAVIGHPIGHSLSPAIHGYWLKELNIDGRYRAHDVPANRLAESVKKYADEGYVGLNVTLPHKESVLPLCDYLSDAARAVGAVNTIVFANNKIYGDNTDATGFADHLIETTGEDKIFHSAIILGAGGAARAVAFALKNLGVEEFLIYNRDVERAKKLIADLNLPGTAISLASRLSLLDSDILVNCTSLGMAGQPPLNFDLSLLDKKTVVADIVYKPLQTDLLKSASKRAMKTVDGLGMLIHQAAAAFEQFYGAEAGEMIKLRTMLERQLS